MLNATYSTSEYIESPNIALLSPIRSEQWIYSRRSETMWAALQCHHINPDFCEKDWINFDSTLQNHVHICVALDICILGLFLPLILKYRQKFFQFLTDRLQPLDHIIFVVCTSNSFRLLDTSNGFCHLKMLDYISC